MDNIDIEKVKDENIPDFDTEDLPYEPITTDSEDSKETENNDVGGATGSTSDEPQAESEKSFSDERLDMIEKSIEEQTDSYKRIATDIREMHKLYHNEFAGRLKSMQDELERYHDIDRGRAFDDILREIARIYCDNEALLDADVDEKVAKRIRYFFMDIEQLLESNGVMLQKSKPGDKRNNKFCQIVERVETDNPELHDTVVDSKGTGFYTEKRPLIKELVDVYVYKDNVAEKAD